MELEKSIIWVQASVNTIQASWWTLLKAKLFGERVVGHDGEHTVVGYYYKDKMYIHNYFI